MKPPEYAKWACAVACALVVCGTSACLRPPLRPVPAGIGAPERENLTKRRYPLLTADGKNLYAWYIPAPAPKAIVLQFHDDATTKSEAFSSLAWLVGAGYGLFVFDYRGYGPSMGEPEPENLQRDALMVLEFAQNFAAKNDAKLIVYGQGLGALVAGRAVPYMQSQRLLAAVVLEGAYASYGSFARSTYRRSGCVFPLNYLPSAFVRDGYEPPAGGSRGPGVLKSVPLIVIHGESDRYAERADSRKLFQTARKPRFFLSLPAGHDVWRDPDTQPHRKTLLKLFAAAVGDGDFHEAAEAFEPQNAEY